MSSLKSVIGNLESNESQKLKEMQEKIKEVEL
jgi:hypothetical protein